MPSFMILWVGSGFSAGLLQAYHWARTERAVVEKMAVSASGSVLGIVTAVSCVMLSHTVLLMGKIPVPSWVGHAGIAPYSVGAILKR